MPRHSSYAVPGQRLGSPRRHVKSKKAALGRRQLYLGTSHSSKALKGHGASSKNDFNDIHLKENHEEELTGDPPASLKP